MSNKEIFEAMANRYDTEERIKGAAVFADEIKKYLSNDSKEKTAIDYGCGTGLVGLLLLNEFESMIFADISRNMTECVNEKIRNGNIKNAVSVYIEKEEDADKLPHADYMIVVQTLLHIKDTKGMIQNFYNMLKEDGRLMIVDFDKNEAVHSDLVHNGFEQQELVELLKSAGFKTVNIRSFYQGKNIFMNKDASMFIAEAGK